MTLKSNSAQLQITLIFVRLSFFQTQQVTNHFTMHIIFKVNKNSFPKN